MDSGGVFETARCAESSEAACFTRELPMQLLASLLCLLSTHGTAVPSTGTWTVSPTPTFYALDWDSGDLYVLGTVDLSKRRIGGTGLIDGCALELAPDGHLYAFDASAAARLYRIDPRTAAATPLFTIGQGYFFEGGLAFAPDGTAYATNLGPLALSSGLVTFDVTGATAPRLVGIMGTADINGLAFRSDGMLVGLDRVTNALVTIDPETAQLGHLTTLTPVVGSVGGMSLVGGTGYFTTAGGRGLGSGSHELWSFDPFTGSHILEAALPDRLVGSGISGLSPTVAASARELEVRVGHPSRLELVAPELPGAAWFLFTSSSPGSPWLGASVPVMSGVLDADGRARLTLSTAGLPAGSRLLQRFLVLDAARGVAQESNQVPLRVRSGGRRRALESTGLR